MSGDPSVSAIERCMRRRRERPPHTRAKPSVAGQRTLARAARAGAAEDPSHHLSESDTRTIRLLGIRGFLGQTQVF